MNVLFLSELFYPHGGGAEVATYLYATLLSRENVNVIVVTNKFSGENSFSEEGPLRIYRLPLFTNIYSAKYSIFKRFDVIFSDFFKSLLHWADVVYIPRFWFSAITITKAHKKPVVVHMHDYISVCSLSNLFNEPRSEVCSSRGILCSPKCIYTYEKAHGRTLCETLTSVVLNSSVGRYLPRLSRTADAIVCVSKKQRDLIVEREKCLRHKSYVIYNPFPYYPEFETIGDDFGYFGGPDVLKGFEVLYAAARKINKNTSNPINVHCTKFQTSAKAAGKMSTLGLLLHKKLEIAELEKLYHKLKAVLVPSIWNEPWPYVTVEALVRGRFVIGSNIGGIPEQLEGCKGAILCDPGNVNMLAGSIEYVNGLERDEVFELGCKNRESFLNRFDNYSSIRKFMSLCENLI